MSQDAAAPFELLGGQHAVDRLVDAFYARMDQLEAARGIRALHGTDLGSIRDVLKRYLGEWLGGPKLYSAERGHPRLRARHMPFPIGVAERDAWMLCMQGALDEVVTDAMLRAQLLEKFAALADWMRNQPEASV